LIIHEPVSNPQGIYITSELTSSINGFNYLREEKTFVSSAKAIE